jgi:asparagine synthase (glutamine-hydrolysing)
MCGLLGIAAVAGQRPGVGADALRRLAGRLAHRGPDGEGVWDGGQVVLAHRRLVVIDPSPAANQPMADARGRGVLAYNGELYNDAELRSELTGAGWEFRSASDTETVLAALRTWGEPGLERLRGMYALAYYDPGSRRLLLARDPLGIKPLYWTRHQDRIAFASEPAPLLNLGWRPTRPDPVTVSAYLTTIRTTLGERTLFEGVQTLEPGGRLAINLGGATLRMESRRSVPRHEPAADLEDAEHLARVRSAVEDSVRRHLRADVPTCCLLSGGLDSTIIAAVASRSVGRLWTYCAGAIGGQVSPDFEHAREVARALGTTHTEAPVDEGLFGDRWGGMVHAMGVPLSTPNEVAINEVACRLRADGRIVALSGEGADEAFAGYDAPMRAAHAYVEGGGVDGGEFQLEEASWVPRSVKAAVVTADLARGSDSDAALTEWYRGAFAQARAASHGELDAHLAFLRRVNLTGLLQRLDTATMLAGVEGRTPFADPRVVGVADSLPMRLRFDASIPGPGGTKVALRRAFAHDVGPAVASRVKASFPLPFEGWLGAATGVLAGSAFARTLFTSAAIATVVAEPARLWRLAWPMCNLALWGERWWPSGASDADAAARLSDPLLSAQSG